MRLTAFVLCALVSPVCAQSNLPPEVLLLSRIRRHAAQDLEHLPNFTCLETIERSERRSPLKPFVVKDVVRVEVARVNDQELFAWPGASNFESRSLAEMVASGMTTTGEYSSHARAVFVSGFANIHYVAEEEMGGHRAARFDYEISPAFSGYGAHVNNRTAVVGVRGSFWADSTTLDLLRLTVEGTDIPDELGVRAILTEIEYARLRIESGDYLLPQSSVVWLGLDSGMETRNRTDFTHCRQYATESVLSFGEPPPDHGPPQGAPAPAVEFSLPPNSAIFLRLEAAIDLLTAKVGDAISATLTSDVKHNGQILAPKGASVSGRVRVLQKQQDGHLVGLEFNDLVFENRRARFLAKFISVDMKLTRPLARAEVSQDLPGVGTFFAPSGLVRLPKGMQMQWRTLGLGK